jgi:20S proteasome subunit beta 3
MLHEQKDIEPKNVARLISNYLYEHRLYCTPIVVGLDSSSQQPYICSMDGLGAQTECNTYAVIGTANELVLGLCESCYRENLAPSQLMTITEKILKVALERDVLSGGQVDVLTLTADGIYTKAFDTYDV